MTIPTISTLPVAPARTDAPATFVTRADAFLAALVVMQGELNTSIGAMNTDIAQANTDATNAAASATAAAGSAAAAAATAGATYWVSGQSYDSGDVAVSLIDNQTYRANTATSGTTDPNASSDWTQISYALPDQTGNSGEFLTTDGTDVSWAEISAAPSLDAIASGSLSNGDTVIVNSDGTVSVVVESDGPATLGGSFSSFGTRTGDTRAVYDSVNEKIVVVWINNTSALVCAVGEISGNNISFGSIIGTGATNARFPSITYSPVAGKIVVGYENSGSSDNLEVRVGTVSGNSISFGSAVTVDSGNVQYVNVIYDPSADLLNLTYKDVANSGYGTALFGQILGTSTSWGTKQVFESNEVYGINTTFDSSANKTIIYYWLSSQNILIRLDNTGGNLTFSGKVSFNSGGTAPNGAISYDSVNQKCVLAYTDNSNSGYGTAIIADTSTAPIGISSKFVFSSAATYEFGVSYDSNFEKTVISSKKSTDVVEAFVATMTGSSLSFDSGTVLDATGSGGLENLFDDVNDKSVIFHGGGGYPDTLFAQVFNSASVQTTLTSDNYIGISDANYSDGQTAKVQIVGSVDDAQSGLTAGQSYYVQADGSLGTSPLIDPLPSVFAGTAVSATKLIVKG